MSQLRRPARSPGRAHVTPRVIGPAGFRLTAVPYTGTAVALYFTTRQQAIDEGKRLANDPYYRRVLVTDQHGLEVYSATAHRETTS